MYLKVEKKYSENTVNSYNEDIKRFSEYLDGQNIDVRKFNKEVVRDYLKYLDKIGVDAIIVSDIEYMIILDEVIAVAAIVIIILELIFFGLEYTADKIIAGILAFVTMYVIKLIGDKLFKRESMGGGDIKLMFLFASII